MSAVISTVNPKNLTDVNPPAIEDTYQDINSDEFAEYSDYEDDEGGPQNPALDQLVDQSKKLASPAFPTPLISRVVSVHSMFSDEDIDHMHTYLKEAGKSVPIVVIYGRWL